MFAASSIGRGSNSQIAIELNSGERMAELEAQQNVCFGVYVQQTKFMIFNEFFSDYYYDFDSGHNLTFE